MPDLQVRQPDEAFSHTEVAGSASELGKEGMRHDCHSGNHAQLQD